MHVGRELGLDTDALGDLYYAVLLKDAGCSSNAARMCELFGNDDIETKRAVKTVDLQRLVEHGRFVFKHTKPGAPLFQRMKRIGQLVRHGDAIASEMYTARCERGAHIARKLGFNEAVARGVRALDEHWNGKGQPYGLRGEEIPMASRIALLAQVADVFHTEHGEIEACNAVRKRSGRWFDPDVVDAFLAVSERDDFWEGLEAHDLEVRVMALEPPSEIVVLDDDRMDAIAAGFGEVIDAKSPFTAGHSDRVADHTVAIAEALGLPSSRKRWLRRAGLLQDIGKLGISNLILDKPGKLDAAEWEEVRKHPVYTAQVLGRIHAFKDLASLAGAHHERLDGKGYPHGLEAEEISLETRIVTVADIYDALISDRPYRAGMTPARAFGILRDMVGTALDGKVVRALRAHVYDRGEAQPRSTGTRVFTT